MRYGIEKETTTLDNNNSTVTLIRKVRDYEVAKSYKQFNLRVKVRDAKEEMAEYLKHTDKIREKKTMGVLVTFDEDRSLLPSFTAHYPKFNEDDSYFIVSSWTEII